MADDTSTTSSEKAWFADMNWRTNAILAILSLIAGGFSGASVVATKGVQAQGITQDQADVRYFTKEDAKTQREARDKQLNEIKQTMVTKEVFDERTKTMMQQNDLLRQELKEYRNSMERMMVNR